MSHLSTPALQEVRPVHAAVEATVRTLDAVRRDGVATVEGVITIRVSARKKG